MFLLWVLVMTPEKLALKRATREMIKGVGGLEAAAPYCRVGKSALGEYQSDHKSDCFVTLDVIADLEPLARARDGWPHVTQALCATMGGVFVAVPESAASSGDLLDMMATLSGEFNDTTRAVCSGLADGKFCSADADKLERELDDVIRVAVGMRALARSIHGGER